MLDIVSLRHSYIGCENLVRPWLSCIMLGPQWVTSTVWLQAVGVTFVFSVCGWKFLMNCRRLVVLLGEVVGTGAGATSSFDRSFGTGFMFRIVML